MTAKSSNFKSLSAAWNTRCSKIVQGGKLWAEGDKLWNKGGKLRDEGCKLWAEGNKLCDEGRDLWDSAVSQVLGPLNSKQIWLCDNTICLLTDGSLWKENLP